MSSITIISFYSCFINVSSTYVFCLKILSGQIGSAWEWYHWIGLEKDINRYGFIFYFWSWIFDKSSKFWASSCKKESNLLLFWIGLHVLKQRFFPPNWTPKLQERHQLFFGLRLVSKEFQHLAIQTKVEQRIFSSNKSAPANRKTGFYANRDKPWSEQAGGWIHFCMKQLKTWKSFQIFKSEI